MVTKINLFHFVEENLVSSIGKTTPLLPENQMVLLPLMKKSNLESIPPHLLYQVRQQNFKDGLILWALYHAFH